MFNAYLLRCADGSYYAGHTNDLDRRIAQHDAGEFPGHTRNRRPVVLVWSDTFPTREEAQSAEARLKGWSHAEKEALIAGARERMRSLALRQILRDTVSTGSTAPQDERDFGVEDDVPLSVHPEEGLSAGEGPSRRASHPTPPPAIILVRPQLGENIGKAARAMLNFGLTELRLVSPRDGWPNPAACPAASGADIVLEQAAVFDSVAAAVADCTHVFATTVRRRGLVKPVATPEAAARAIHAEPGRSAILFGPERSGLETEDVALARTILTVPINPEFGSLNLAQAVVLVAYEWSKGEQLAQPSAIPLDPPAPQAELDGLYDHLEQLLEPERYFEPSDRAHVTRRNLRSVLTKPAWSSNEVRTLRGVLTALSGRRQRRSNASNS